MLVIVGKCLIFEPFSSTRQFTFLDSLILKSIRIGQEVSENLLFLDPMPKIYIANGSTIQPVIVPDDCS